MVAVERDTYRSTVVLNKGEEVRIDEGDFIQFATETGELITGRVTKISGKGEKTKLQIVPKDSQKEEIWSVMVMSEDSLIVVEDEEA